MLRQMWSNEWTLRLARHCPLRSLLRSDLDGSLQKVYVSSFSAPHQRIRLFLAQLDGVLQLYAPQRRTRACLAGYISGHVLLSASSQSETTCGRETTIRTPCKLSIDFCRVERRYGLCKHRGQLYGSLLNSHTLERPPTPCTQPNGDKCTPSDPLLNAIPALHTVHGNSPNG